MAGVVLELVEEGVNLARFLNSGLPFNSLARVNDVEAGILARWLVGESVHSERMKFCVNSTQFRPYIYNYYKRTLDDRPLLTAANAQKSCEYALYVLRYMMETQGKNGFPFRDPKMETLKIDQDRPLVFESSIAGAPWNSITARIDIENNAVRLLSADKGSEDFVAATNDFADLRKVVKYEGVMTSRQKQWTKSKELKERIERYYNGESRERVGETDRLITSGLLMNLLNGTKFALRDDLPQDFKDRINVIADNEYRVNALRRDFTTETLSTLLQVKRTSNKGDAWPKRSELSQLLREGKAKMRVDGKPSEVVDILRDGPEDTRRVGKLLQLWQDPLFMVLDANVSVSQHRRAVAASLINLTAMRLPYRRYKLSRRQQAGALKSRLATPPASIGNVTRPFFQWLAGNVDFPLDPFFAQRANLDGAEIEFMQKVAPWSVYTERLMFFQDDLAQAVNDWNRAVERNPQATRQKKFAVEPYDDNRRLPWLLSLERVPELNNEVKTVLYYMVDDVNGDGDVVEQDVLHIEIYDVFDNDKVDPFKFAESGNNDSETAITRLECLPEFTIDNQVAFQTRPRTFEQRMFKSDDDIEVGQRRYQLPPPTKKNLQKKTLFQGFRNTQWPRLWLSCVTRVTSGKRGKGGRSRDVKKRKKREDLTEKARRRQKLLEQIDDEVFNASLESALCDRCDSEARYTCEGCKQGFYCSEKCQKESWSLHREHCAMLNADTLCSEMLMRLKISKEDYESYE